MKQKVMCSCQIDLEVEGENEYEIDYNARHEAAERASDRSLWKVIFQKMPIGIIVKDQTGNKFIESCGACAISSRKSYVPISTVSNYHLLYCEIGTEIEIDESGSFQVMHKEGN